MKVYLGTLVPWWYLVGTSAGIVYMGFRTLKDPPIWNRKTEANQNLQSGSDLQVVTRIRPTRDSRSSQTYKLFSMEYESTKGMKGRLSCHWYRIIMRVHVFVNLTIIPPCLANKTKFTYLTGKISSFLVFHFLFTAGGNFHQFFVYIQYHKI